MATEETHLNGKQLNGDHTEVGNANGTTNGTTAAAGQVPEIPAESSAPAPEEAVVNSAPKPSSVNSSGKPTSCPESVPEGEPALNVKCGPLLRYLGIEDDTWRGSVLIVTDDETSSYDPAPTLAIGKKVIDAVKLYQEFGVTFWRFPLLVAQAEEDQAVTYSINGRKPFTFHVPAVSENFRVMAHSCNGFSFSVDTDRFKGSLWDDVIRQHAKNPYHVMLGGGDQIYCDAVKKHCKQAEKWFDEPDQDKKNDAPYTDEDRTEISKFYLNHYIKWFGHGYMTLAESIAHEKSLPIAMATIPMVNIFDDHDIIDGFGSYPNRTQIIGFFSGLGQTATKYYYLFQQQTNSEDLAEFKSEPSWVVGSKPGPYLKEPPRSIYTSLGPQMGLIGVDCRSDRTRTQVISEENYAGLFARLDYELKQNKGLKHLLVMIGVPAAYPRMVWLETILGSKFMAPVKFMAKHGVMKGLVNPFDGRIELLDDLDDHWCAKHHKRERNLLMHRLMNFAKAHSVRITVLSGDVHLTAIGRFFTKHAEPTEDPNLMMHVVTSAIVNTPPGEQLATFLNKRRTLHHFSIHIDEDMVGLYSEDTDGSSRSNKKLFAKRNFCTIKYVTEGDGSEYPGPRASRKNQNETKYFSGKDSLLVTINVEQSVDNDSGETVKYDLPVPPLLIEKPAEGFQFSGSTR